MPEIRSFLRERFLLSVVVFPLFLGLGDCPTYVQPPPEPNLSCQTNVPLSLQARRCARVEPLCFAAISWRHGDTFTITGSSTSPTESLAFNRLELHSGSVSADGTIMRRVCQSPYIRDNPPSGLAQYEYTFQGNLGRGLYNPVSISGYPTLNVAITGVAAMVPMVYDRPQDGIAQYIAVAGGGFPPYSYQWFANGVPIPGQNNDSMLHVPTRNTEYRVRVFDTNDGMATSASVIFLTNVANDPNVAFTAVPETVNVGQTITLDTSTTTGTITRWEWDFDWQGDITEPFDSTINGASGTTTTSYAQPGRKYIRLRATTAAGNFDETFRRVSVVSIPSANK